MRTAPYPIPLERPSDRSVLLRLLTHGPLSRVELARQTGLSAAAVTRGVIPLLETGYLREAPADRDDGAAPAGRPADRLAVVADRLLLAGVHWHDGVAEAAALDLAGIVRGTATATATDAAGGPDAVARAVRAAVGGGGNLGAVGLVARDAEALRPWLPALTERVDMPVHLGADLAALTAAERLFGAGRDADTFALVRVEEEDLRCGLVAAGREVRGGTGVAGALGHLPLGPEGVRCRCGAEGCLALVASRGAILARPAGSGRRAAQDRAARGLARALATLANLLGPELLVVTGPGAALYAPVEATVRAVFAEHAFGAAARGRILVRPDDPAEQARAAAVLALERTIGQPSARVR